MLGGFLARSHRHPPPQDHSVVGAVAGSMVGSAMVDISNPHNLITPPQYIYRTVR